MPADLAGPQRRYDGLLLSVVGPGVLWIIWGVSFRGYCTPQIASQLFTIGLTQSDAREP